VSRPTARPLIGLSSYRSPAQMDSYHTEMVALPSQYLEAITLAGGVGVVLPPQPLTPEDAAGVIDTLDGLVLSGGWDIDPHRYGQEPSDHLEATDPRRDDSESSLLRAALEADIPVLGICRGAQLLNVHMGGTLHQHVPAVTGSDIYRKPGQLFTHEMMTLEPGTTLAAIFDNERLVPGPVQHHQAIDSVGDGLVVAARGPDGIVQGVEAPQQGFCVAVQWHPEENLADIRIFEALIGHARTRQSGR
jgi:putative glutamine amidotransferase